MNEVLLTIHGTRHDLGRAVDQDGTVLAMLGQRRRTMIAAKTFFRKLLEGCQDVPRVIVTEAIGRKTAAHTRRCALRLSPLCCVVAAVLLVCWLAGEAVAQSGEGPVDSPTEGSIGLLLEEERRPKAGIFAYGPVSLIDQPWQEFNDWLEQSTRFRLGLDNTIVFQQATNGPGDRTGASGELNLFGKGRLIGTSDQDYAGYLGFKGRYRYQIGSQTPNDLDSQIGTLWSTTDGFGFSGPLGRTNDFAGMAGSWGRAATGGRQSQWVFEAFYRFQLAPRLQFTPGYQLIVNPLEGSGDVVGIFEARLRVAF